MASQPSADFVPLISRNAANEAWREALRLFIGRGRRYSVKQASNGSGVHPRMIESFVAPVDSQEYRKPDIEEILSLSKFLGSAFTSEWLRLAQQAAIDLPDDDLPPGELAADNAEDNATLTRAAANGRFDNHEKPALRTVGLRMIERGRRLAAA